MRRGLLGLATLSSVGIALELAVERHWTNPAQLIAWGAVALLIVAIGLLTRRPGARRVQTARTLAWLVIVISLIGVWEHIAANYDAGPLNFRYASVWDNLSELTRWWMAVTKTVGAAPPLAPGALAQVALTVLLSTVSHPALERRASRPTVQAGTGRGERAADVQRARPRTASHV